MKAGERVTTDQREEGLVNRPQVVVLSGALVDGRLTLAPDVLLLFGDERWQAPGAGEDVNEWLKHIHKPQANLEGSRSELVKTTTGSG